MGVQSPQFQQCQSPHIRQSPQYQQCRSPPRYQPMQLQNNGQYRQINYAYNQGRQHHHRQQPQQLAHPSAMYAPIQYPLAHPAMTSVSRSIPPQFQQPQRQVQQPQFQQFAATCNPRQQQQ